MQLNDIVAISGLLLTLVTFLFNLAWPKISDTLNQDSSVSGDIARSRCRTKINNTLWGTVLPIQTAFFALFYVNLPTALKIIGSSSLHFWNFDVHNTLYVMVVCALLAFVVFNGFLIVKLFSKQASFK